MTSLKLSRKSINYILKCHIVSVVVFGIVSYTLQYIRRVQRLLLYLCGYSIQYSLFVELIIHR